ncbi:MAG: hypothetical protein HQ582_14830, partial [Planctomycetes bacterium]|nr:hypothetical protein [Planctomycetota bacterium]
LWSWWLSGQLPLWERVAATAAVMGHHGQLHSTTPEAIRRLASDARNGAMLNSQLGAMDLAGVGRFLLDSGSRFLLPVPTTVPGRQQLLDSLESLHCNALHSYLSGTLETWEQPPSATSELMQFLEATRERDIGVWLTLGLGPLAIRDADDAGFPQYYCVNGPWGSAGARCWPR